jgi:hypothetical protein
VGFKICGGLQQVGRKFGRWLDIVYMQRMVENIRPGTQANSETGRFVGPAGRAVED